MAQAVVRRVGATELRTLAPGTSEYRRWIDISAAAYPITKLVTVAQRNAAFEEQRDLAQRQPEHRLVGAFRGGSLVGGMRVYDFEMCVRGARMFSGGIGSLAVGLEYKQRGIATDLVRGFLAEYLEREAALAVLYPFRPDFYRKFGFGYGSKLQQYRIALDALPADGARERVRLLGTGDASAFLDVYERIARHTNGLIRREPWRAALRLANETFVTFGYFDAHRLSGYLCAELKLAKSDLTNRNELYVHELLYETPAALAALLAFVRSQRDQFSTLVMNTQDPDFHFVPVDPRNGSDRNLFPPVAHETNTQGIGVMYRVLDLSALFCAASAGSFGTLNATVRIELSDPLGTVDRRALIVRFEAGRALLGAQSTAVDVDLALETGDFSALVMGSVRLRSLVAYGRATLSKPDWLRRLDSAFEIEPPQCLTRF